MTREEEIKTLQELRDHAYMMMESYDNKNSHGLSKVKWIQEWRTEAGRLERELDKAKRKK
jgi:hypothetical protein